MEYVNREHPLSRALYIIDAAEREVVNAGRCLAGLQALYSIREYLSAQHRATPGAWI